MRKEKTFERDSSVFLSVASKLGIIVSGGVLESLEAYR